MGIKKGLALVLTNSDYSNLNKLESCTKDGIDMVEALEILNFDIIQGNNLIRDEMYDSISRFLEAAELYSTLLVYYSGHGVQIDGENYFVPIECTYNSNKALFINTQLVDIKTVTEFMAKHAEKTNIMILDACRTNPGFSKDMVGSGLAEINVGNGTIIAFATAPNTTALCTADASCNSYYTKCLVKHIITPNIKIEDMFKNVRNDVVLMTSNEQVPWENTSLNRDFYFNTMTQDELNEKIYLTMRNFYSAESLIFLSRLTGYNISEVMRIYTIQKSEKPGGIYFEKSENMESFILSQILELGFEMINYRWCLKGKPVKMGEFYHDPATFTCT